MKFLDPRMSCHVKAMLQVMTVAFAVWIVAKLASLEILPVMLVSCRAAPARSLMVILGILGCSLQ